MRREVAILPPAFIDQRREGLAAENGPKAGPPSEYPIPVAHSISVRCLVNAAFQKGEILADVRTTGRGSETRRAATFAHLPRSRILFVVKSSQLVKLP
jgi:hypothetical protein